MKSKFRNFPGISIDSVLIALLVALVITMIAGDEAEPAPHAAASLRDERARWPSP
jgi:hypothetical protein